MITITTAMSGQVVIYDHRANRVLDSRRDHQKFVVKVATVDDDQRQFTWVATAGWDAKIFLYRLRGDIAHGTCFLGEPAASVTLPTNPEIVTFLEHPDSQERILLVTRKDSTSLHYYSIEEKGHSSERITELKLMGSQNLAPSSNAWISFSPSAVALCPIDRSILAVATSAVPHMKLIVVKLLFPSPRSFPAQIEVPVIQESQIRDNVALEHAEDAAIQLHVSTFAPQTPYSTPQVCWRPDGSGLWVNGDDGVLRGVEAKSGKVVSTLKGGHESGFKIRSLWAGMVAVDGQEEEWVVSGGFDKRLVVWRPGNESKREG